MGTSLEQALMYAGMAKDIDSLKSLARAESSKVATLHRLLSAVLAVSGPIRVCGDMSSIPPAASISIIPDGDTFIVAHKNPPNLVVGGEE